MTTTHQAEKYVQFKDLGSIDYKAAWDLQTEHFEAGVAKKIEIKRSGKAIPIEHQLFFCEHPHVYTLGKSGSADHLLLSQEELFQKSISFYNNNRGGDITYHGPGQIVGYPILDLEQFEPDIKKYMWSLEEVMIRTLADYGIEGQRVQGAIGVWLEKGTPFERKICAFGVKTSRWMTMHGWALNVNTDLSYFNFIVPCGISDKGVTSMQKELNRFIELEEVKKVVLKHFQSIFEVEIRK